MSNRHISEMALYIQCIHEKTPPPKYNAVVFKILGKTSAKFLQLNLAYILTLCAKIRGNLM